jgi:hypothetical protein
MGLDITAFSRAVLVGTSNDYDDLIPLVGADEDVYIAYRNNDFPGREAPYVFGGKDFGAFRIEGERIAFRAGSYSGYGEWRSELCSMANKVGPDYLWNTRSLQRTRTMPFYDLIDFADNEGVIGSIAATRLVPAFSTFMAMAELKEAWFFEKYQQWHRACVLAADNGFIYFH